MKGNFAKNIYYFLNDDQAYLDFIIKNGGYVYNDFGGKKVEFKKLHRFDCSALHNLGRGLFRTSVRKICSNNLNDLLNWLNSERGPLGEGYSKCGICMNSSYYATFDFNTIIAAPKNIDRLNNLNNKVEINQINQNTEIKEGYIREFSEKLIDIYNNKKIPLYVKHFRKAGFTKKSLTHDINKIFQIIIIAAYDQQPFTRAARGWEPIWFELPQVFQNLKLNTIKEVKNYNFEKIDDKLRNTVFYNYHLDSKGTLGTSYAETFLNAAYLCEDENILNKMLLASNENKINEIQTLIAKKVKNIGKMIASKIIMYTMREIKIGISEPKDFNLIAGDLLGEYHNKKFIKEIELKYGKGFIDRVIKDLNALGDPLAIDSLYFVDRDLPELKKELL